MIVDPHDLCLCGDYRRDHPNDGPCIFGRSHGIPRDLPYAGCDSFRLARGVRSVLDTDAPCDECVREGTEAT